MKKGDPILSRIVIWWVAGCLFGCLSMECASAQGGDCVDCRCLLHTARTTQRRGDFQDAINLFIAARGYCFDSIASIDQGMLEIFHAIQDLRLEALAAKKRAELASDSIEVLLEQSKSTNWKLEEEMQISILQRAILDTMFMLEMAQHKRADSLLAERNQLVDAFFFFEDSLALAYHNHKFGFVNKAGVPVVDYLYDRAENYLSVGFARVERDHRRYLIDRYGIEYKTNGQEIFETPKVGIDMKFTLDLRNTGIAQLYYRLFYCNRPTPAVHGRMHEILLLRSAVFSSIITPKYFTEHVITLDLSGRKQLVINERTFRLRALKILLLGDNLLHSLPSRIANLNQLQVLDLSNNFLSELPVTFGDLQNLTELDLSGNRFRKIPPELLRLKNLRRLHLGRNPIDLPCERILQIFHELLPECDVKL